MPKEIPGYERKYTSAPNVAPNTSGLGALAAAISFTAQQEGRVAAEVAGALGSLAKTASAYEAKLNEREMRDIETQAMNLIRERKMHAFSLEGKEADGLLDDENKWQEGQIPALAKESHLSEAIVKQVWNRHAQPYLTQVGGHMLKEGKVAEANSKLAFVLASQDDLALSKVGDFSAFAKYSARVKETYANDAASQAKFMSQGLDTMIDSWAAANPQGTLSWFRSNQAGLKQVLGRYYADASQDMTRIENQILTRARRAAADASRAYYSGKRAQEAANAQAAGAAYNAILSGESRETVMANLGKTPADGQTKLAVHNAITSFGEQAAKEARQKVTEGQNATFAQMFVDMSKDANNEENSKLILDNLASGNITVNQGQQLHNQVEKVKSEVAAEIKPYFDSAVDYAVAMIGGKNSMALKDGTGLANVQKFTQGLLGALKGKSPKEAQQMLDINNENSYVRRLMAHALPKQSFKSAFGTPVFDWSAGIQNAQQAESNANKSERDKTPGTKTNAETVDERKKRPGESVEVWKARIAKLEGK